VLTIALVIHLLKAGTGETNYAKLVG